MEARAGEVREILQRRKHWYWRVVIPEKPEREVLEEILGSCLSGEFGRRSETKSSSSSGHSTPPDREWLRWADEEEEVAPHQWMCARWDAPMLCPKNGKKKSWELPSSF